ncbi:MAG: hypothetical protein IJI68_01020 [Eggerthellaceae bacterium]|nr:hypothetical protein [Eggerthellaceae bacterium]
MKQQNGASTRAPKEPCVDQAAMPEQFARPLREVFLGMRGEELYREWVDAGKPRRATA